MSRRVLYLTGTRADFGLMQATLKRLADTPGLSVGLCVTGMHLSSRFGMTVREIEDSGLSIVARIPVDIENDSGIGMARVAAQVAQGLVSVLAEQKPDILLLLGDRSEMLAGAMSGMLAGIPVAHLCGGERSGTVDDSMRHAISKLAHLHLVATENSRERLLRMGEEAGRIFVVGTPGLVGLESLATRSRDELARIFGLDANRPIAAMLFHPVVQDAALAGDQCLCILRALDAEELQCVCLMPNSDSGNSRVRETIESFCNRTPGFRQITHLRRADYVSLMAIADLLIGNSSSGIIEAATFGTPVVNVGDRQQGRERNHNVVDVSTDTTALRGAIRNARQYPRTRGENIYGDGRTDVHVADILSKVKLDTGLFKKCATY